MIYNNYIKNNNKLKEQVNSLLSVSFVLSLIVYVTIALILTGFVSIYRVNGASATPYIEYGDVILDVKVPASELEVGDVITKSVSNYDNIFDQAWSTVSTMFFGRVENGIITHQIVKIYGADYEYESEPEATVVAEVLATYATISSVTYREIDTDNYFYPETSEERKTFRLDTEHYEFISQEVDMENLIQSEYDNSEYRENPDLYTWVSEEIKVYDEDANLSECYFLVRSTGFSEALTDTNDPGNDEFGGAIPFDNIRGRVTLSASLKGIKNHGNIVPVILMVVTMLVAVNVLTKKREADFIF